MAATKEKKLRSDAWEASLPEETREKLYLLVCGLSNYTSAVVAAREEMGIELPETATYYRFLERMRAKDAALRLARSEAVKREVEELAASGTLTDGGVINAMRSLGAEEALKGNADAAEKFFRIAEAVARQSADAAKLRLAREKFEAAEKRLAAATDTVSDERLTDAERVSKIRELFGLK